MPKSTLEVFFYGLFMDESILLAKGIKPISRRKASLADYGLRIGERATLVHSAGETAYGIVMRIDTDYLGTLYSEKTVSDYLPEDVEVITEDYEKITAICYILPANMVTGSNTAYAMSLLKLAEKFDFPGTYLNQIEEIATSS